MYSLLEKIRTSTSPLDAKRPLLSQDQAGKQDGVAFDSFAREGSSRAVFRPGHKTLYSWYDQQFLGRDGRCPVRFRRAHEALISRLLLWEKRPEVVAFCDSLKCIKVNDAAVDLSLTLYLDHGIVLTVQGFACLLRSTASPHFFRKEKLASLSLSETTFYRRDVARDLERALGIGLSNSKAVLPEDALNSTAGQRPRIGRLYLLPDGSLSKEAMLQPSLIYPEV